jgi:diaminohydroxyphosphoribosylaminopyrimidine deaminase/5-amino-6-(5-phosphoribosylamino)uracil reductase
MAEAEDFRYMAEALRLAQQGRYTTQPNPQVGCLLVAGGEVVGAGWHTRAGTPHAEILALQAAGERARGSTAYVTLEPCNHHGRTPPCSVALLGAGVRRVVCGSLDPNPHAAGGLARLAAAGVAVESGVLAEAAERLNKGFFSRMSRARPWLRLKLAMSLDARTAMADGESRWISSEASRRDVQRLRAGACAVLTGLSTVLHDDPRLDLRLTPGELGIQGEVRQPLRVILDPRLRTPRTAKILQPPGEVLLLTAQEQPAHGFPAGVSVEATSTSGPRLDLTEVLRLLARRQLGLVQAECGATLAGALITAGLVDELLLYLAPHLMGSQARGLALLPQLQRMSQRLSWRLIDERRVGPDLRLTLVPAGAE